MVVVGLCGMAQGCLEEGNKLLRADHQPSQHRGHPLPHKQTNKRTHTLHTTHTECVVPQSALTSPRRIADQSSFCSWALPLTPAACGPSHAGSAASDSSASSDRSGSSLPPPASTSAARSHAARRRHASAAGATPSDCQPEPRSARNSTASASASDAVAGSSLSKSDPSRSWRRASTCPDAGAQKTATEVLTSSFKCARIAASDTAAPSATASLRPSRPPVRSATAT